MSNRRGSWVQKLMGSTLSPFWGTVTRNWILKLVCLVLALAVWQGIRESTSFKVEVVDVPVTIIAGDGLAVLDQSTDVVSISFRGSSEDIRFVNRDQLAVELVLSDRPEHLRQTIRFTSRHVKAPSRAYAEDFHPTEVTVTVDREVERVLPVKATFEGNLPEGIQLEKAVCEPASVRVRGAEQRLLELEQLRTIPINLDGRYGSFNTHVAIAANGQPWTVDPERVSVALELVERVASRRFEKVEVRALLGSEDSRTVRIRPETVDVVLKGAPERLEGLSVYDAVGYVDCTELTEPADYEVPVRVDVPQGVQVEEIDPPVVQVVVKIVK